MSSQVRGHRPTGENPWVCPNDRQLALRAKLKSGWSVKTSSLQQYRKPAPLDEREQHVIVNVIQKAESFEKKEQMRVGKLVERLDNMRRHAVGNGASTCVLCGEKFGLLASSKLKCKDCHKAVCHKCVVDTSTGGEQWLLCKICAETREVWKKSGAWFFKGMPRYVMPESKRPPLANGTGSRRRTIAAESLASPRTGARYSWAKHVQTSTNGEPSSPITDGRTTAPASSRVSPPTEPRTGPPDRTTSLSSQRSSSLNSERGASLESGRGASLESERGASPARTVDSSSEDEDAPRRSAVRRVTTYERVAPQLASPAEEDAPPTEATTNGDVPQGSCPEGTVRRSWSGLPTPNRAKRGSLPTADSASSDCSLSRHSDTPSRTAAAAAAAAGPAGRRASVTGSGVGRNASNWSSGPSSRHGGAAGTAEFSVMVDPSVESIHCCVHRVRGLCPMDGGTVNAYVKLHIVPGLHKTNKLRTQTVVGSTDPEFSETLTYCNVPSDMMATSTLLLSVLDENPNGHDVLGETLVRLSDVPAHRLHYFSKPLLPIGTANSGDCESYLGRILLSLKYVTSRRVLVVGVVRCVELPSPDGNGVPDTFVRVQLRPAPAQFKTAIRWKSPNPKFNEEFCFRCRRSELPRHTLDLRIYDKDISSSNDFIGSLQLSIDSQGARLRHWFDALNYADTRHDRWHELSARGTTGGTS